MDLDAIADELYGLPREEFTAARDARAKAARGAGERDLAAEVKRLAKPTAAAWLANRLAREHPDDVRSLLDLGDALREATAARDGEELRRLTPRRNDLLRDLAARAHRLADAAGQRVTDDTARGLDDTLRAALADPDLGERLSAGRLTDVLEHAGFPTLGFAPAPEKTAPAKTAPAKAAPPAGKAAGDAAAERDRAARLPRAEKDLADARARAEAAEAARVAAEQELTEAAAEAQAAAERIHRLRDQLARAEAEQDMVDRREARARKAYERAETAADTATGRLARATAARDALS